MGDPDRYELLTDIKSFKRNKGVDDVLNCQPTAPPAQWQSECVFGEESHSGTHVHSGMARCDEHGALDFYGSVAAWLQESFKAQLSKMVGVVNNVRSIRRACNVFAKMYGVQFQLKDQWRGMQLNFDQYPLERNPHATASGRFAHLSVAPIKSRDSAARKLGKMESWLKTPEGIKAAGGKPETPTARYVTDFLRATIVCEDPLVLVLIFEMMSTIFEVQRVDNKYDQPELKGNPSVLMNILVSSKWGPMCAEVQLMLQGFQKLKQQQHRTYEISRAGGLGTLMLPIYDHNLDTLVLPQTE